VGLLNDLMGGMDLAGGEGKSERRQVRELVLVTGQSGRVLAVTVIRVGGGLEEFLPPTSVLSEVRGGGVCEDGETTVRRQGSAA